MKSKEFKFRAWNRDANQMSRPFGFNLIKNDPEEGDGRARVCLSDAQ
jgi:hypothetical protein